jgi:hypothetical protein
MCYRQNPASAGFCFSDWAVGGVDAATGGAGLGASGLLPKSDADEAPSRKPPAVDEDGNAEGDSGKSARGLRSELERPIKMRFDTSGATQFARSDMRRTMAREARSQRQEGMNDTGAA